jgi:hypothetical protein
LGFELRKPTLQFFSLFGDSLKKRERGEEHFQYEWYSLSLSILNVWVLCVD